MMKTLGLILCLSVLGFTGYTQTVRTTDTISSKDLHALMTRSGIDSAKFLRDAAQASCACIDSVYNNNKEKQKQTEGFAACIDK